MTKNKPQPVIVIKKKGYTDWTKTLNVTGGSIHLNADLEHATGQ